MTLKEFAKKNVLRDKETYIGYFLSSAFTVLVFFIFSLNQYHPELNVGAGAVATIMQSAQIILIIFTIVFLLLSVKSFLNQRIHLFGSLLMMGMSKKQLRKMLFFENLMIGIVAIFVGLIAGNVIGKLMVMIMGKIINTSEISYYFPIRAILTTIIVFLSIFLIVSWFGSRKLLKKSISEMLSVKQNEYTKIHFSSPLAILSLLFLAIGYTLASIGQLEKVFPQYSNLFSSVMNFSGVELAIGGFVILGMYLLFKQFSQFFLNRLKKNSVYFLKGNNALWISELMYKIKSNANTMFLTAVMSTGAFVIIIATISLNTTVNEEVALSTPNDLLYYSLSPNQYEKEEVTKIENTLNDNDIEYRKNEVVIFQFGENTRNNISLVDEAVYNNLVSKASGQTIDLVDYEALSIPVQHESPSLKKAGEYAEINEDTKLSIVGSGIQIFDSYRYQEIYVVDTDLFKKLASQADYTQNAYLYSYSDNVSEEQNRQSSLDIREKLGEGIGDGKSFLIVSRIERADVEHYTYEVFTYIGGMLSAVFLIGAASLLYFRLISNVRSSSKTYSGLYKIGLSEKQLQGIQRKQLFVLFFSPVIVAIVNTAFAMNTLMNVLNTNVFLQFFILSGSFIILEVVYFLILNARFKKKVRTFIGIS